MNAKKIYRAALNGSAGLFGVRFTKKLDALLRFRRTLNLTHPVSLADKLCYMELFIDNPLKVRCSDKYAVREYVTQKGLGDILVPLCHEVCADAGAISYAQLPDRFVMKATHGCGMNLICADKKQISPSQIRDTAEQWLSKDYERACLEPHYKKIPRRVIFEKMLQDADQIVDYKFHCFHGEPDFVLVCSDRMSGLKLSTYSLNWEPMDVLVEKTAKFIPKPENLEQMIQISRTLCADFDFVRVDLYDINGKVYFGELTFSPATGLLPYFEKQFLIEKGRILQLST